LRRTLLIIMRDDITRQVHIEMSRANVKMASFANKQVDSMIINSHDPQEAPYLSMLLPRLAPLIGNMLERRVADILNKEVQHGFHWITQEQELPDTCLMSPGNISTESGYEVKAWHALSAKITSRFRVSTQQLKGRNIRLLIISWMMSKVLFGVPTILDVLSVDAYSVARLRDLQYHQPPEYLVVEGEDPLPEPGKLYRSQLNGYRIMERDPKILEKATTVVASHPNRQSPLETEGAQSLNKNLLEGFEYRLDSKFGKIDLAKHAEIEAFKENVLRMEPYGHPIKEWPNIMRGLQSHNSPEGHQSRKAIQELYR
jgi:hypothetical protein